MRDETERAVKWYSDTALTFEIKRLRGQLDTLSSQYTRLETDNRHAHETMRELTNKRAILEGEFRNPVHPSKLPKGT